MKPKQGFFLDSEPTWESAYKQDRLKGWPSTISLGGTITFFLNMLFKGWDEYIVVGRQDIHLWELCLYFMALTVAFLPASIKDAKRIMEGQPPALHEVLYFGNND